MRGITQAVGRLVQSQLEDQLPHRIPLPSYARKPVVTGSSISISSFNDGVRASQAATFYPVFMDTAFGLSRESTTDPMNRLRQAFTGIGLSQENWELHTKCLAKYIEFLQVH